MAVRGLPCTHRGRLGGAGARARPPEASAMTWSPGPVVTRRRLGGELRRLRESAGLKLEDVARRLECSPSKISRLENG
ncbi:MAG TPA: helix-turn-helix transcriptional regulator, partial [Blastococcus sp.]|nr:helix-turn-helix transcriptional regulator [Blastococcus sp.]